MDEMAREWVNAKLEAAESRVDARLVSMDAKIDKLVTAAAELATSVETKQVAEDARMAAATNRWAYFAAAVGIALTVVGLTIAIQAYALQNFEAALAAVAAKGGA